MIQFLVSEGGSSGSPGSTPEALASELNLLVDLSHPNIGKLTGFEQDLQNGIVWMFSTWEANGNLSEFLATRQWNIPERLSLVRLSLQLVKILHDLPYPLLD